MPQSGRPSTESRYTYVATFVPSWGGSNSTGSCIESLFDAFDPVQHAKTRFVDFPELSLDRAAIVAAYEGWIVADAE